MLESLNLAFHLFVLIISFVVLHHISKHYFIDSLDLIAKRFKIPSDIAGSTLMAAGSSAPELAVVIVALCMTGQHEEIGIGTIVGSALFNILMIVGVVLVLYRSKLVWQPLLRDLLFYSISLGILYLAFQDGSINLFESLIFVVVYVVYVVFMVYWKKLFPYANPERVQHKSSEQPVKKLQVIGKLTHLLKRFFPEIKNYFLAFGLSIIAITALSWVLVESAIRVSNILGISELIIGLTILAIGTSIPDLVASIIVTKQGRPGMAINNAIGSNIFDILIGFGLPWFVVLLMTTKTINVDNSNLTTSMSLLSGSLILLVSTFIITKWRTKKIIGGLLIFLYLSYLLYEILNAL